MRPPILCATSLLLLLACHQEANPAATPAAATTPVEPPCTRPSEEWLLGHWRDEHGALPTPAQWALARQQRADNAAWHALQENGNLTRPAWTERGPDNFGGRTRALLIDPTRPWRMWAGAVSGGLWRSDTYGSNWEPVDDTMRNLAIGCLAMAPGSGAVLYAGTGEGFCNTDATAGAGIWRSSDGGSTWTQLANTAAFGNIARIIVSPTNANLILAATTTGVRRTTDGGTSWTTAAAGPSLDIAYDPNNPARVVANTPSGAGGFAYSTDFGATWFSANTPPPASGRFEFAFARSVPGKLYALSLTALLQSLDGGATWSVRTATGLDHTQACYNAGLWVDPTNDQRVVVGRVQIFRSSNGGATFTTIGDGPNTYDATTPHHDVHGLVADPRYDGATNKSVYALTDGGIFRAVDITTCTTTSGWTPCENGYRTIQCYGVAGHGNGRLVAGTQDNGTFWLRPDSGAATRIYGGDGGRVAIDPVNPDFVYGEYVFARVVREDLSVPNNASVTVLGVPDADTCAEFVAPFLLDPSNRDRMLVGGCSLWRSNDVRLGAPPTWVSIKSPNGSNITAVAISPSNSDIVWVGHLDGRVYRTGNATAATPTWVAIDDNGTTNPLPGSRINAILINRTNNSDVFLGLGGFTANNLRRTTNNGTTWASASGSGATALPAAPVLTIAQHPQLDGAFYVGTEVGVFDSLDTTATWGTSNDGPVNIRCSELVFARDTTTLLLATYGRGLWTAQLPAPGARPFGAGCAGSNGTPSLTATPPRIGLSATVTAQNLPLNQPRFLLEGPSRILWYGNLLPFDLAPFGAPNCRLLVSPDRVREFPTGGATETITLPIANSTALVGREFFVQAAVVDPTVNSFGYTFSNAVALTIGP